MESLLNALSNGYQSPYENVLQISVDISVSIHWYISYHHRYICLHHRYIGEYHLYLLKYLLGSYTQTISDPPYYGARDIEIQFGTDICTDIQISVHISQIHHQYSHRYYLTTHWYFRKKINICSTLKGKIADIVHTVPHSLRLIKISVICHQFADRYISCRSYWF